MKRHVGRKIVIGVVLLFLVIAAGSIFYMKMNTYEPNEAANVKLESTEQVTVTEDEYIEFMPTTETTKGLIFYPGGLVEPEAYAPLCYEIAKQGYFVVIVPMTANLAILSKDRAQGVIEKYPEISTWAIGGHSLGGVMACKFAANSEDISALILYAAYPQSDELEGSVIPTASIYGSMDGVADLTKVKGATLSTESEFFEIAGGNHSYFGSYGLQKGDNEATITPEEQIEQAATITVQILQEMEE